MISSAPKQFEVILDHFDKVKVSGGNLIGDIDYMYASDIKLFKPDEELKTIFLVTPSIISTDTNGTIVEMEAEIMINVYKYEHPFTDIDLYGLFCHAYIVGYHVIRLELQKQNIMHNDEVYHPTMTIPTFDGVKDAIYRELGKVYG